MTLTLYDMPGWAGATAFDALQKWQTRPGKMAFYKSDIFGVVESPGPDRRERNDFIAAVAAAPPPGAYGWW